MNNVLLLNATNEPLNICSWKRAISLLIKGKAEEVNRIDYLLDKYMEKKHVIKLRYYVAVPEKGLPISKRNIIIRDNYTCQYCGKQLPKLTIDHIHPKSRGGPNTWENLVAACAKCNGTKADRTPEEANMKLLRKPFKPNDYMMFELMKYNLIDYDTWDNYLVS